MHSRVVVATKRSLGVSTICIALLLIACGDNSQQARETLVSWSKSLELVEQQHRDGRVPATYVHQMTHAATTALNQNRKQLPGDPVVDDLESIIRRGLFAASARS